MYIQQFLPESKRYFRQQLQLSRDGCIHQWFPTGGGGPWCRSSFFFYLFYIDFLIWKQIPTWKWTNEQYVVPNKCTRREIVVHTLSNGIVPKMSQLVDEVRTNNYNGRIGWGVSMREMLMYSVNTNRQVSMKRYLNSLFPIVILYWQTSDNIK